MALQFERYLKSGTGHAFESTLLDTTLSREIASLSCGGKRRPTPGGDGSSRWYACCSRPHARETVLPKIKWGITTMLALVCAATGGLALYGYRRAYRQGDACAAHNRTGFALNHKVL